MCVIFRIVKYSSVLCQCVGINRRKTTLVNRRKTNKTDIKWNKYDKNKLDGVALPAVSPHMAAVASTSSASRQPSLDRKNPHRIERQIAQLKNQSHPKQSLFSVSASDLENSKTETNTIANTNTHNIHTHNYKSHANGGNGSNINTFIDIRQGTISHGSDNEPSDGASVGIGGWITPAWTPGPPTGVMPNIAENDVDICSPKESTQGEYSSDNNSNYNNRHNVNDSGLPRSFSVYSPHIQRVRDERENENVRIGPQPGSMPNKPLPPLPPNKDGGKRRSESTHVYKNSSNRQKMINILNKKSVVLSATPGSDDENDYDIQLQVDVLHIDKMNGLNGLKLGSISNDAYISDDNTHNNNSYNNNKNNNNNNNNNDRVNYRKQTDTDGDAVTIIDDDMYTARDDKDKADINQASHRDAIDDDAVLADIMLGDGDGDSDEMYEPVIVENETTVGEDGNHSINKEGKQENN